MIGTRLDLATRLPPRPRPRGGRGRRGGGRRLRAGGQRGAVLERGIVGRGLDAAIGRAISGGRQGRLGAREPRLRLGLHPVARRRGGDRGHRRGRQRGRDRRVAQGHRPRLAGGRPRDRHAHAPRPLRQRGRGDDQRGRRDGLCGLAGYRGVRHTTPVHDGGGRRPRLRPPDRLDARAHAGPHLRPRRGRRPARRGRRGHREGRRPAGPGPGQHDGHAHSAPVRQEAGRASRSTPCSSATATRS